MSYYGEKSADSILKQVISQELDEMYCGKKVSSKKLPGFIAGHIFKSLVIPIVIALYGTLCSLAVPAILVACIMLIISFIQFATENKLVALIAHEAKKAPDKKISTIISEICVCEENDSADFRRIKRRHTIIKATICSAFGLLIAGVSVYYFVPFTIYSRTEGGYAVSLCRTGLVGKQSVERYHNGEPVVGIKSGAYKNNYFMRSIEFHDSITFIEGEAFMNCVGLKSVEIPPLVTEIRGDTFHNCKSLQNVLLHDNITDIHAQSFMGCESLREITLPHGITEIHESTFNGCYNLMRIDIPEGVTRIAARAFFDCNSLYEVIIPRTVTEIGSSAFRDCDRLESMALPEGCTVNERTFKDSPTVIRYY